MQKFWKTIHAVLHALVLDHDLQPGMFIRFLRMPRCVWEESEHALLSREHSSDHLIPTDLLPHPMPPPPRRQVGPFPSFDFLQTGTAADLPTGLTQTRVIPAL